jgi:hypothetical protein
MKKLQRELSRHVRAAALADSPAVKGVHLAEMMGTVSRIGDAAAAADSDDPYGARAAATSAALKEAKARVGVVRRQREWSEAGKAMGSSILCFLGGVSILVLVALVTLLTDVLFWGIGILGLLLMLGGGVGTFISSIAAIDAFSRRHPLLRAVTKIAGCALLVVVIIGAIAIAVNATAGSD